MLCKDSEVASNKVEEIDDQKDLPDTSGSSSQRPQCNGSGTETWHYCRRTNVMMELGRCGRNVTGRDKASLIPIHDI